MQTEVIETIHGHAMFVNAPYTDSPKLYNALWEHVKGLKLPEMLFIFQCFDTPEKFANPTHEYVCLIGTHQALAPIEGVKQHTIQGGKNLTTIHKGAYNKVGAAYQALLDEVAAKHLKMRGVPFEIYINDPSMVKEEELLTKVCFPIE
ncbi:Transcription_activator effector binding [Hexamita inflata]|uniref:Transcription activator effector binding n=1 Tax=Hexamita inflata TaxID=28002 RepID=A0AA86S0Z3_9EUKA|nr:Transcription activator effector binding [Hexamita inflata]